MRKSGFTLVEIMIVVAVIGLLAAIAVPNYVRARNTTFRKTCINNLRQVDSAKQQWALENRKTDSDTPGQADLAPYIKNLLFPACPAGGSYTINAVSTDPTCSKSAEGHVLPPE
jgi:prepilin-type N-terminal cleavage/methylation domain-containing protein